MLDGDDVRVALTAVATSCQIKAKYSNVGTSQSETNKQNTRFDTSASSLSFDVLTLGVRVHVTVHS